VRFLDSHRLPMVNSKQPREAERQIAQYLTDTKVEPLGEWRASARVGGAQIGGFSFALIEFDSPVRLQADVHADHFLMMSCLQGTAKVSVDGQQLMLNPGDGVIARPTSYVRAECSKDCVRFPIRIDPRLIAHDFYPDPEAFNIDTQAMRPWLDVIHMLLSSPAVMDAVVCDEALTQHIEGMLHRLLQNLSPQIFPSQKSPAASGDVRRAEIYMRANASRNMSLEEIAVAAAANVRTLQNNFLRYRNVSPMQYLRNLRLDHARDLLSQGSGQVLDIALQSGFSHLGRFAAAYRARFGESPSATLQHRQARLVKPAHRVV
jgi:AraC-like DNA-binding protein